MRYVTQDSPQTTHLWWGATQIHAYSLPVKHCLKIGGDRDLEELVGSKQCFYIMFTKNKCKSRREIKKMVLKFTNLQWDDQTIYVIKQTAFRVIFIFSCTLSNKYGSKIAFKSIIYAKREVSFQQRQSSILQICIRNYGCTTYTLLNKCF